MKPLAEDIKVGKKKSYLVNSIDCPICIAVDATGKDLRPAIDRYIISHTIRESITWMNDELGLHFTPKRVEDHIRRHSPYIEDAKNTIMQAAQKVALSRLDKLEKEYVDAEEVIQDIITIGGHKIRSEEIRVDGKLLIAALKEQGLRKKTGSLQQLFQELDKTRFAIGEVVEEDEIKELEEPDLKQEIEKIDAKDNIS